MTENVATVFTPYAAAKEANIRLKEEGLNPIPPQMMYNYTTAKVRAGKKPLIKFDEKKGVDRTDFLRWLEAYVEKKTNVDTDEAVSVEG